jgi:squalene-associated FAD-dependent desaturase
VSRDVHIVGAGLAGLSAALHASAGGARVHLYEGAQQAGGRCRSYFDRRLGRQIDNGNHLVLSGNHAVARYLRLAGAEDQLETAPSARFPFVDIESGERWEVAMNDGPLPWWPLLPKRRPPGVSLRDMAGAAGLLLAGRGASVASAVGGGTLAAKRFWEPMAMAVVNLPPARASAELLRATALEAWRDGRLARPMFAPRGLGPALIDPALARLEDLGAPCAYGRLLKAMAFSGNRVTTLHFAKGDPVHITDGASVVLALPPHRLSGLMPGLDLPDGASEILNAHFLLEDPAVLGGRPRLLGVVGGLCQWIFIKGDIVSLTISAADHLADAEGHEDEILERLWRETKAALDLPSELAFARGRLVREKRATFLQTPANLARRPQQKTSYSNLFLAGDFVDTGLPATIEGAVRSGERAARLAA